MPSPAPAASARRHGRAQRARRAVQLDGARVPRVEGAGSRAAPGRTPAAPAVRARPDPRRAVGSRSLKQRGIYRKLAPVTGPTMLTWAAACCLPTVPVTDDAARAEVERLAPQLAAVRKLPFHAAAAGAGGLRRGDARRSGRRAQRQRRQLEHRRRGADPEAPGLIPPAADYTRLLADATFSSPVPYYDPGTKRLLVPASEPLDGQRFLLAHEIAHALGRSPLRHRSLRQARPRGKTARRRRAARPPGRGRGRRDGWRRSSFIDRRGNLHGPYGATALAERLRSVIPSRGGPPWLAELARFSHVDGFTFIARIRAHHPWSAVDAVWLDPPASSEQVLHPEKYEVCEEPVRVDDELLPAALPGFERRTGSAVLGELLAAPGCRRACLPRRPRAPPPAGAATAPRSTTRPLRLSSPTRNNAAPSRDRRWCG